MSYKNGSGYWKDALAKISHIFNKDQTDGTIADNKKGSINAKRYVVGVDFGTKYIKMAYAKNEDNATINQILFKHHFNDKTPEYCQPSLMAIENGKIVIGAEANKAIKSQKMTGIPMIKMYMAGKNTDECISNAGIYKEIFDDRGIVNRYFNNKNDLLYFKESIEVADIEAIKDVHMKDIVLIAWRQHSSDKENRTSASNLRSTYKEYLSQIKANIIIDKLFPSYLAWLFNYAKKEIAKAVKTEALDIEFNVSIPIDHLTNNKSRDSYEQALALAQVAHERTYPSDDINRIYESIREVTVSYEEAADSCRVFMIPEAQAQVSMFLRSMTRKNGRFALIDFGAGTTDVSIMDIRKVQDPAGRLNWLASRSIPCGISHVITTISRKAENRYSTDQILDMLSRCIREKELIEVVLKALFKKTRRVWAEAYIREYKTQSKWESDKIKIYICGGGAEIPVIKEIFKTSPLYESELHEIEVIQVPEDILYSQINRRGHTASSHRMLVAYGMTSPKILLRKNVLPAEQPIARRDKGNFTPTIVGDNEPG